MRGARLMARRPVAQRAELDARPARTGAIGAQLADERARRTQRHELLVKVLRRLLRPRIGGRVVASTLRRLLRMAGLDPTTGELAGAALVLGGRYSRVAPSVKQRDFRRAYVDVELLPEKIFAVATVVGGHWEKRLRSEGMRPEPPQSRHLEQGTPTQECEHLAVRAHVAAHVQQLLTAYVEVRIDIPEQDRQAIGLYLDGMSVRVIAERLGVAYEAVRDRLTRHKTRAGLGLPPHLRKARNYLHSHDWTPDPVHERLVWERFAGGDGYRTIARELGMPWREVVATLHRHRLQAGIEMG